MMYIKDFVLRLCAVTGGVSASIVLLIKFGGKWIADYFEARYKAAIDSELELLKTKLSKRQYVTQKRFDKEYETYEELSCSFYRSLHTLQRLIPENQVINYPENPEERKEYIAEGYKNLRNDCDNAEEIYGKCTAFIIEEAEYGKMLELMQEQITQYKKKVYDHSSTTYLDEEDYNRTKEARETFERINKQVRIYLRSLEVE